MTRRGILDASKPIYRSVSTQEVSTGKGTLVKLTGPDDLVEKAAKIIPLLKDIELPHTQWVDVPGSRLRRRYSRFNIIEHKVKGTDDLLCHAGHIYEIKDGPEDKVPIVIDNYTSFSEWTDLKSAKAALELMDKQTLRHKDIEQSPLPGQLRVVNCYPFDPWYNAIGNQIIVGDIVFPDGFQDDPVYKAGKSFVVYDGDGNPSIKICLGCRLERYHDNGSLQSRPHVPVFRTVYFEDGTVWNESRSVGKPPRPLAGNEIWIADVLGQVQRLLLGGILNFKVPLVDDMNFIGRLSGRQGLTLEGTYYARVSFEDGTKEEGYFDFKPYGDFPTVEDYLRAQYKRGRKTVSKLEVKLHRKKRLGKSWGGALCLSSVPGR